ncbi:MAG: anti-sigma factor antagonist [Solirubrobacteraceae bacterium]|jgi:anti-sigma B factor antagonist|nr:anti-sigma factor antagonist [Solirubrobacteraceae bacterium]
MSRALSLAEERVNTTHIISATGELDSFTSPELSHSIGKAIEAGQTDLLLDLNQVTFLDSTGLGVLLNALRRLARAGGRLRLVCDVPAVLRVFQTTRLDRDFAIFPTRDHALGHWGEMAAG